LAKGRKSLKCKEDQKGTTVSMVDKKEERKPHVHRKEINLGNTKEARNAPITLKRVEKPEMSVERQNHPDYGQVQCHDVRRGGCSTPKKKRLQKKKVFSGVGQGKG